VTAAIIFGTRPFSLVTAPNAVVCTHQRPMYRHYQLHGKCVSQLNNIVSDKLSGCSGLYNIDMQWTAVDKCISRIHELEKCSWFWCQCASDVWFTGTVETTLKTKKMNTVNNSRHILPKTCYYLYNVQHSGFNNIWWRKKCQLFASC